MEDIDGGLHPAVDGQSLDEDEDEVRLANRDDYFKAIAARTAQVCTTLFAWTKQK